MTRRMVRLGGLFDGTRRWPGPVDVGYEGDRIVSVSTASDDRADHDLSSVFGLPGLVDSHCHLATDRSAGLAERFSVEPARLLDEARRNAAEVLGSGVTTVADCGGRDDVIFRLRDEIATGVSPGPTILAAGLPISVPGGHAAEFGEIVGNGRSPGDAVETRISAGSDFIKVILTPGGGERGPAILISADELIEIADVARTAGLRVTAHVHDPEGITAAIAAGIDGIEHGTFMRDGEVLEAERERRALAASGMTVCPTHAIDFRKLAAGEPGAPRPELIESWRRTIASGVTIVGGSDVGVPFMRYDDYALVPELMVYELGLSSMDALHACTAGAADYIWARGAGRIAPGSRADLLAVEGDPTGDISVLRAPVALLKRGTWVDTDLLVRTTELRPAAVAGAAELSVG